MKTPLAYLNGRFVPFADAALPLHDAGFVSGATVVDNARTFRHELFRWPDHLERFRRDCATCHVPLEAADEQLTATAAELVAHNAKRLPPGGELQLVTFATPGPLGFYLGHAANGPPTLGMVTYPLPVARYRPFFTDGVSLAVAGRHALTATDILPPAVKHRSRLHWHVADHALRDPASPFHRPGSVAVLHDGYGAIDTAVGAVLAVAGRTVYRCPPDSVLDSISLKVVAGLCRRLRLGFRTAPFDMYDLWRPPRRKPRHPTELDAVTEVLLAGTGFGVAGVREFAFGAARPRAFEWPGPVFRKLLAAWSDLVGVDVEGQFVGGGRDAPG